MTRCEIFDTTVRDGSYAINFQFTAEDTAIIAAALERAGVRYIEIGHGLGLNASNSGKGLAAASDESYLQAAANTLKSAHWGMFFIPGIGRMQDLKLAADYGIHFVRIGTNVTEVEQSKPFVEYAKKLGMFVTSNLMKTYAVDAAQFKKQVQLAEGYGTDVIYIVDSAGSMFPEDIQSYAVSIKDAVRIPFGVHCHENLSLGIANCLKAVECGASFIDSSLQGMGRSAGNPPTEILAAVLKKKGLDIPIDVNLLMDAGERLIKPLIQRQGLDSLAITSGFAGFHSSYLNIILKYADRYSVDARDLIVSLCEHDKVGAPESLVEELALDLSRRAGKNRRESPGSGGYLFAFGKKGKELALSEKVAELARSIRSTAVKSGKKGVLNLVAAPGATSTRVSGFVQESFSFVIGNASVGSPEDIASILSATDGLVDVIFVDSSAAQEGSANYATLARGLARNSLVLSYLDGDAWVRSVEHLVSCLLDDTAGLKITIYGGERLGLRLALHLAERGSKVTVWAEAQHRSQAKKFLAAVEKWSAFPIALSTDSVQAAAGADVLVGMSPGRATIGVAEIKAMKSSGTVVDGGIRTISREAVKLGNTIGLRMLRVDMRATLAGEIAAVSATSRIIREMMGQDIIAGIPVIAGGIIGNEGDIVLDSIHNPTAVVGVADGEGSVLFTPPSPYQERIAVVENELYNRKIAR